MGNVNSSETKRLHSAIKLGDSETVHNIVAAHPHLSLRPTFWRRRNAIHLAAKQGNVLSVATLLFAAQSTAGEGFARSLNEPDTSGATPLALASKYGHLEIVNLLLEEGATPLPANRRGETPAHLAAQRSHAAVLQVLLDAPVASPGGGTISAARAPVQTAAFYDPRTYIDSYTNSGFSPLHLAAIARSPETCAILVSKGAQLDVPVMGGYERLPFLCGGSTPLHIAASCGDVQTCLVLVEAQWRHANLELWRVRNMLGITPLNCALSAGHYDVARLLVASSRRSLASATNPIFGGGGGGGGRSAAVGLIANSNLGGSLRDLQTPFPDALRRHLLGMVARAQLLVQLREILLSGAVGKVEDLPLSGVAGLDRLSSAKLRRVQSLLKRDNASLRDVLAGLEGALQGQNIDGGTDGDEESEEDESEGEEENDEEEEGRSDQPQDNSPGISGSRGSRGTASGQRRGRMQQEQEQQQRCQRRRQRALQQQQRALLDPIVAIEAVGRESLSDIDQLVSTTAGAAEEVASFESAAAAAAGSGTGTGTVKTAPAAAAVDANDDDSCQICMDAKVQIAFKPCSHGTCFRCACRLCVRATEGVVCPYCRAQVQKVEAVV